MHEDDVVAIMADPLIGVGSDNGSPVGVQHPRTWGCFPEFFGRFVRDRASSRGRRRSARRRRRPRSSSTWRIAARCSPARSPTSASSIRRRSRIRAAMRSPPSPRWDRARVLGGTVVVDQGGVHRCPRGRRPPGRDRARKDAVTSSASLRVAMLAPISWRVPPRHYGPWEQFVSLLTEGLVDRGVDVTLFAAADSRDVRAAGRHDPHGVLGGPGPRRRRCGRGCTSRRCSSVPPSSI